VVELKVGTADEKSVGQVLRYMTWVECEAANPKFYGTTRSGRRSRVSSSHRCLTVSDHCSTFCTSSTTRVVFLNGARKAPDHVAAVAHGALPDGAGDRLPPDGLLTVPCR